MPRILKDLVIDEVSVVIKGSNPGAKVMLRKSDDDHYWADYQHGDFRKAEQGDDPADDDTATAPLLENGHCPRRCRSLQE
jgi:hypothetical protein